MSVAINNEPAIKVAAGMSSQQEWCQLDENFSVKVLSVDEKQNSVEALFKIKGGYRSGEHKHTCETHVFVLEGKVTNHSIGCTFGAGDYCFQPLNDIHDEEFVEDTIAYVSYRGVDEKLVEFFDDAGNVCGNFKVDDFLVGLNA